MKTTSSKYRVAPRHKRPPDSYIAFHIDDLETRRMLTSIVASGGFETPAALDDWYVFDSGIATLSTVAPGIPEGIQVIELAANPGASVGIGQNLLPKFTDGTLVRDADYRISAFARLADSEAEGTVAIQIQYKDQRATMYPWIAQQTVSGDGWTELVGGFRLAYVDDLEDLQIQIVGLNGDAGLLVDDVQFVEYDWESVTDQGIEEHRKRDANISFFDNNGNSVAVAEVQIQQVSHEFGFGTAIHSGNLDDSNYVDFVTNHFEWVAPENAWKWAFNEETQDVEEYGTIPVSQTTLSADGFAQFALENELQVRGHNVLWSNEFGTPQWAFDIDTSTMAGRLELLDEVNERITSIVSRYGGSATHWDVVNELLVDTFLRESLDSVSQSGSIIVDIFNDVEILAADAALFLNEYNVLNGGNQGEAYRSTIDELIAGGVNVGGIGFQSHFVEQPGISSLSVQNKLDEFRDYGLPLWITEFDNVRADATERAKDLEVFFRTIFSHSSVEGAMLWGFWEGDGAGSQFDRGGLNAGPNAALVNSDWTLNEAGQMFVELLNDWTTSAGTMPDDGPTDSFDFRGFHGTYEVTVTLLDGQQVTEIVTLESGSTAAKQIDMTLTDAVPWGYSEGVLSIAGTAGNDRILIRPGSRKDPLGSVRISLNEQEYGPIVLDPLDVISIRGLDGDDVIKISRSKRLTQSTDLFGDDGNDRLVAGRQAARLRGGRGDDILRGSRSHDTLLGGDGQDDLRGYRGDDLLDGGVDFNQEDDSHADVLRGGQGRDQFTDRLSDLFKDFRAKKDVIDTPPNG